MGWRKQSGKKLKKAQQRFFMKKSLVQRTFDTYDDMILLMRKKRLNRGPTNSFTTNLDVRATTFFLFVFCLEVFILLELCYLVFFRFYFVFLGTFCSFFFFFPHFVW